MNKCINCGQEANPASPMNLGFGNFCSSECEIEHELNLEDIKIEYS